MYNSSCKVKIALCVCMVAALLVLAVPASFAQDSPKGITVSGQSEVSAAPDIARISVGVTTEDKDAAKAAAANAQTAQRIMDALAASGIAKKDIQTSQFSVQPVYDYKAQPPKLTGYQVSNIVRVTVRDLKKVGDVIDKSLAAGANNIQGVSFEIDDDSALRNQALKQAVKVARDKANLLAEALGVKINNLQSASESVGSPVFPVMYARAEMAGGAAPTPVLPGQVTVTATVSLVYSIVP